MTPMSASTATQPAAGPRATPRLPFTVYALVGVLTLKAMLLLAVVAGANMAALRPVLGFSNMTGFLDSVRDDPIVTGALVVFAALLLFSVFGILLRRRSGWLIAMVITGLFVALDIYGFFNNAANHLWMGLNILTVFYLNQQDVREVVGAATTLGGDPAGEVVA